MGISLSDIASVASILSLLAMVVIWLVTKDRFSSWWKKWSKYIFLGFFIVAIFAVYRMGCLNWLCCKIEIPTWLILLIGVSGFLIIWLIRKILDFVADSNEVEVSDVFKYTHDIIFDISCQWNYKNGKIDNSSLSFFCSNKTCSSRLEVEVSRVLDYIIISCPHCGFKKQLDMSVEYFGRRVLVEIERRLRTGEYKGSINT